MAPFPPVFGPSREGTEEVPGVGLSPFQSRGTQDRSHPVGRVHPVHPIQTVQTVETGVRTRGSRRCSWPVVRSLSRASALDRTLPCPTRFDLITMIVLHDIVPALPHRTDLHKAIPIPCHPACLHPLLSFSFSGASPPRLIAHSPSTPRRWPWACS